MGITLKQGTVVTLAINGTLIYVEDVQPAFVAVLALPDQPETRQDERVFTPGSLRAKKISPYSSADSTMPLEELSEPNRKFISEYEQLRIEHGQSHNVLGKQETPVTVIKMKGRKKKDDVDAHLRRKCAQCGEQPGHPIHRDHDFIEPTESAPKTRTPKVASGNGTYRVISDDLTAVQAANDKFKDGNRFHRVFLALKSLPDSTGTVEAIIVALVTDGGRAITNPEKVTRRALKQLVDFKTVQCQ